MQARFKPGKFEPPREDEAEALEAELGPLANPVLRCVSSGYQQLHYKVDVDLEPVGHIVWPSCQFAAIAVRILPSLETYQISPSNQNCCGLSNLLMHCQKVWQSNAIMRFPFASQLLAFCHKYVSQHAHKAFQLTPSSAFLAQWQAFIVLDPEEALPVASGQKGHQLKLNELHLDAIMHCIS